MSLEGLLGAAPIIMLIVLGVVLRVTRIVIGDARIVLTRVVYYVTIPSAIFGSIARASITRSMLFLPLVGFVVPVVLSGVAYLLTRRIAHRAELRGVMVFGMVVLGVFGYPFLELYFGREGLVRIAMYDVGNSVFAGTVALWLAHRLSPRDDRGARGGGWKKMAASPIMLAAIFGVGASLLGIPLRGPIAGFVDRLAAANTPLAMIAVGVYVRPRATHSRFVAQHVATRVLLGGVLGWATALALRMEPLDLIVASVGSILPVGTTTLVYAANEGFDAEFAASVVSITVIVGSVLVNVLPGLLAGIYL